MLQQDEAEDYVIATGENHTVREFADVAFRHVRLDYMDYVKQDPRLMRPNDVHNLLGNPKKATECLGWNPNRTPFEKLVKMMVDADISRWENVVGGIDAKVYSSNRTRSQWE